MGDTKKRSFNKSNYHSQYQKKKRVTSLEPGLKGFFCTCNFQEKNCVREAYNILNEYADKLYGPQEEADKSAQDAQDEETEGSADIADELQKQIANLKSGGKKLNRFQSVMTSVPNCIFIKTVVEDPIKLGYSIIQDFANTRIQKTRYLLRLVPIEATCSAKIEDIVSTAGKVFDKHFLGEATTFSIVFNRRYNNSISRDIIIKELAELIVAKNCNHKADLTKAKAAVIVEVIKGNCLIGVVPDYFLNKKYNLLELCAKADDGVAKENANVDTPNDDPQE